MIIIIIMDPFHKTVMTCLTVISIVNPQVFLDLDYYNFFIYVHL